MARSHQICFVFLFISIFISEITTQSTPEVITINIKNGNNLIEINWVKTRQYVANEHLPIWKAHKNQKPTLLPGLMETMEGFTMYQDIEKSSAVVFFEKSQTFFGVIDTRFYINGLPLSEVLITEFFEVGGSHIKLRSQDEPMQFHDEVPSPLAASPGSPMDLTPPASTYTEEGNSKSHTQDNEMHESNLNEKVLYAEILLFVTNDVVQHHTKKGRTLFGLIASYLVHFNAIDMLYAKLAKYGVVIHINIAGVILEAERIAFPYVNVFVPERAQMWHIIAERTVHAFQGYLRTYEDVFPRDSYDMFYISTDYGIQHRFVELSGVAISRSNVYENRLNGFHEPLGVLVTRQSLSAEYIASAHELAHTMNIEHDSMEGGRQCDSVQCYAILQQVGSFCRNCILWSTKSIKEFQEFASTNKGHCFLLNKPRSLHPYGIPKVTLTPREQCLCYGYESHHSTPTYLDTVSADDCNKNLACTRNNILTSAPTLSPVDGTPCDINKVCWRNQCTLTNVLPSQPHGSQSSGTASCLALRPTGH